MSETMFGERQPKRVLITGAGGAIGSALWAYLTGLGISVTGLSLEPAPRELTGVFIQGDATSPRDLAEALDGVDTVVHLAAIPHPNHGSPFEVYRTNVTATFNVISAAGERGIHRVVVASSINAFGIPFNRHQALPDYFPLDENNETDIADAYSLSKLSGELAAEMAARTWGIDVVSLRFPLVKDIEVLSETAEEYRIDPSIGVREGWSYLETGDAVRAIWAAATRPLSGAHVLSLSAADTLLDIPTEVALAEFAPGVPLRHPLPGFTAAVDAQRAADLLGFEPAFSLREARAQGAHSGEVGHVA